jgi:hypothetical protein
MNKIEFSEKKMDSTLKDAGMNANPGDIISWNGSFFIKTDNKHIVRLDNGTIHPLAVLNMCITGAIIYKDATIVISV